MTGADPQVWQQLQQLGLLDAAADGAVTAGLLLEETGYGLLPAPLFSTVALAAPFGADTARPTTLAWAEPGRALGSVTPITTSLDGDRVTGTKVLVPDLGTATHAVVTTTAGQRLVAIADCTVVPPFDHRRHPPARRPGPRRRRRPTALPDIDLETARTTMLALAA